MPSSALGIPTIEAHGAAIPRLGLGTWQLRGESASGSSRRRSGSATRMSTPRRATPTRRRWATASPRPASGASGSSSPPRCGRTAWATATCSDRSRRASGSCGCREIDLLLLHWPNPAIPLAESIRALNEVKRDGMTRHIGLSNFTSALLAEAWRLTAEPFAAEQIEYHPYLDQTHDARRAALARHGADRLLPDRARQGGRRSGDRGHRRGARPQRRAGRAALAGAAGRRRGDPAGRRGSSGWPRTWRSSTSRSSDDEMARMGALARPGSRLVNEPQWVAQWD